jgi:hypothetical protein
MNTRDPSSSTYTNVAALDTFFAASEALVLSGSEQTRTLINNEMQALVNGRRTEIQLDNSEYVKWAAQRVLNSVERA